MILIAKQNKYNVGSKKERTLDGIVFDSVAEKDRYADLKLLERAGEIAELKLQPQFVFFVHLKPVFVYKADFSYFNKRPGGSLPMGQIFEDVKGVRTPLYQLKKKLIEAQFDIKITEIDV